MPRARFDDQSAFHPKICAAGNAAVGLWFRMTCYCNAQLTDGFVAESVARLMGSRKELEGVVTGNLAHKVDGGYQVHDFLDHNPSAEEVKAYREELSQKRSAAGKAGGHQSGKNREAKRSNLLQSNEAKGQQIVPERSKQNEALSVSVSVSEEFSLSRVGARADQSMGAWSTASFRDLWLEVMVKVPTGNSDLLASVAGRCAESARIKGLDPKTRAAVLLDAFKQHVAHWSIPSAPPQLRVEAFDVHFAACEAIADGERDPKAKAPARSGQAAHAENGERKYTNTQAPMAPIAKSREVKL